MWSILESIFFFLYNESIKDLIIKLDFKPLKQRMSHINKKKCCLEGRMRSILKKEVNPLLEIKIIGYKEKKKSTRMYLYINYLTVLVRSYQAAFPRKLSCLFFKNGQIKFCAYKLIVRMKKQSFTQAAIWDSRHHGYWRELRIGSW